MFRLLLTLGAILTLTPFAFAATQQTQNPILTRFTKIQAQADILSQENIQLRAQIQEVLLRLNMLEKMTGMNSKQSTQTEKIETSAIIKKSVSFSGVVFTGSQAQISAMKQFLLQKEELLSQAGYVTNLQVGLFEFIAPTGIFISFDSGTNPEGVTAFPLKIAYQYQDEKFIKIGVFEYQTDTGKYSTKFGTNPFVTAQRVKLANPLYTGKLIGIAATSSVVVTPPATTVTSIKPITTEVPPIVKTPSSTDVILSLKEIQSLRTTKFNYIAALDAARLASAAQPESLEFRKEIYINLFMLTKTQEALNEIAKIEKITGTLPKAIACDAVMLSRNAKLKDLEAKYTPICKK